MIHGLIKDATCYKISENSSSTDLILTNNACSFQNSDVIETGLWYFHIILVTVINMFCEVKSPSYKL